MPEYDNSIPELIKGALRDAQDLIRHELEIARTEFREEVARAKTGVMALLGAALAALLALVFLLSTLAWGLAAWFEWPAWAGFGVVTLVVALVAVVLALTGRARLAREQHMPRTVETMKENLEWTQARTGQ